MPDRAGLEGVSVAFRRPSLPEPIVHFLLSNPRRYHTIRYLRRSPGAVSVNELSTVVAEIETGESPPPRDVRESVYSALAQNHLPALADRGVVAFDRDRREVTPLSGTRDVKLYMEVVTRFGITWAEYYQYLAIVSLVVVVAALAEVPYVSRVPPILWASGFLVVCALSTAVQLWRERYAILRRVKRSNDPYRDP